MADDYKSNFVFGVPKIIDPTHDGNSLSVSAIASSKVQVYWGPNQLIDFEYSAPTGWPREGLMLRLPYVCRVIWEKADLDATAFAASGFAGGYTYGIHIDTNDIDITTPPGIYPVHGHLSFPYPQGIPGGVECYAIQFTTTITGHLEFPNGNFDANGSIVNSYIEFNTPEFSLVDYNTPGSAIAGAIQFIADITLPGSPGEDDIFEVIPPLHIVTPPAPSGVGIIKTGNYIVDGSEYNDGSNLHWPSEPINIPVGYEGPHGFVPEDRNIALREGLKLIKKQLREANRSTYPYFSQTRIYDAFSGINLPPIRQVCLLTDAKNWVPTRVLNILIICKPHVPFEDGDLELAKKGYESFWKRKTLIYVDKKYMNDCHLPLGVVENTIAQWHSFTDSLKDFGWIWGGAFDEPLTYHGETIPEDITNAINAWFPVSGPDCPTSIDPQRPDDSVDGDPFIDDLLDALGL